MGCAKILDFSLAPQALKLRDLTSVNRHLDVFLNLRSTKQGDLRLSSSTITGAAAAKHDVETAVQASNGS